MQVIEQHPYVSQVVSVLPGEGGIGEVLGEDPALEFLENEIMKIGSLAHNDIDWSKVEQEALTILSDRSKHLKVLGFLLLALQRGGDGERFALSLYLLHRVLDEWWEKAWPYPGEKGQRARKMMFTQMLQRAGKGVEGLSFDGSVGDGRQYCLNVLASLLEQASARALPEESLSDLKRAIEKLPVASDTTPATSTPTPESERKNAQAQPSPATSGASLGTLSLDPGNERATRQSLLKVADLLTDTGPGEPLGYQLRRYAIWHTITTVPPTRDGQRTDLAAVSADRVADYREALEKTPDQGLWQRVEQSLSVSPFWLDGHWLSAQVANRLGHGECAEAIRRACREFVERLPQLPELTFNDGTPFLSEDAGNWLWTSPTASASGSGVDAWEQVYGQARERVVAGELAEGMQLLEEGLAKAREPRDRLYWRLASARLMKEAGLKTLSAQLVQDLQAQVRGLALDAWEPTLVRQLETLG